MSPIYQISNLSEFAVIISFEQSIDEQANEYIFQLGEQLTDHPFVGLQELVPAFASLTVYYDMIMVKKCTQKSPGEFVRSYIENVISQFSFIENSTSKKRIVEVPVTYDGEDLAAVMEHTKLGKTEIIQLHTAPIYRVFMMGFLPGFAYLGGMDKRLATPRRATPRLKVPAGSVGIAGEQTGIYPLESPGGWQLIGHTNINLFPNSKEQLTLLNQGDYIKFVEI